MEAARGLKTCPLGVKSRYCYPILHRVTHNLKKVANRCGVHMVFPAPKKLSRLCSKISSGEERACRCSKKHANPLVQCDEELVCEIPLSCGKSYVGQTSCCVNTTCRIKIMKWLICWLTAQLVDVKHDFNRRSYWDIAKTCAREVLEPLFINMKSDSPAAGPVAGVLDR